MRAVKRASDISKMIPKLKQVNNTIRTPQLTNFTEGEASTFSASFNQIAAEESDAMEATLHRFHKVHHGTNSSLPSSNMPSVLTRLGTGSGASCFKDSNKLALFDPQQLDSDSDSDSENKVFEDCLVPINPNQEVIDIKHMKSMPLMTTYVNSNTNHNITIIKKNSNIVIYSSEGNTIRLSFSKSKNASETIKDLSSSIVHIDLSINDYISCVTSQGDIYIWKCYLDDKNIYQIQRLAHILPGENGHYISSCFSLNTDSLQLCCCLTQSVLMLDIASLERNCNAQDNGQFLNVDASTMKTLNAEIIQLPLETQEYIRCSHWTIDNYTFIMTTKATIYIVYNMCIVYTLCTSLLTPADSFYPLSSSHILVFSKQCQQVQLWGIKQGTSVTSVCYSQLNISMPFIKAPSRATPDQVSSIDDTIQSDLTIHRCGQYILVNLHHNNSIIVLDVQEETLSQIGILGVPENTVDFAFSYDSSKFSFVFYTPVAIYAAYIQTTKLDLRCNYKPIPSSVFISLKTRSQRIDSNDILLNDLNLTESSDSELESTLSPIDEEKQETDLLVDQPTRIPLPEVSIPVPPVMNNSSTPSSVSPTSKPDSEEHQDVRNALFKDSNNHLSVENLFQSLNSSSQVDTTANHVSNSINESSNTKNTSDSVQSVVNMDVISSSNTDKITFANDECGESASIISDHPKESQKQVHSLGSLVLYDVFKDDTQPIIPPVLSDCHSPILDDSHSSTTSSVHSPCAPIKESKFVSTSSSSLLDSLFNTENDLESPSAPHATPIDIPAESTLPSKSPNTLHVLSEEDLLKDIESNNNHQVNNSVSTIHNAPLLDSSQLETELVADVDKQNIQTMNLNMDTKEIQETTPSINREVYNNDSSDKLQVLSKSIKDDISNTLTQQIEQQVNPSSIPSIQEKKQQETTKTENSSMSTMDSITVDDINKEAAKKAKKLKKSKKSKKTVEDDIQIESEYTHETVDLDELLNLFEMPSQHEVKTKPVNDTPSKNGVDMRMKPNVSATNVKPMNTIINKTSASVPQLHDNNNQSMKTMNMKQKNKQTSTIQHVNKPLVTAQSANQSSSTIQPANQSSSTIQPANKSQAGSNIWKEESSTFQPHFIPSHSTDCTHNSQTIINENANILPVNSVFATSSVLTHASSSVSTVKKQEVLPFRSPRQILSAKSEQLSSTRRPTTLTTNSSITYNTSNNSIPSLVIPKTGPHRLVPTNSMQSNISCPLPVSVPISTPVSVPISTPVSNSISSPMNITPNSSYNNVLPSQVMTSISSVPSHMNTMASSSMPAHSIQPMQNSYKPSSSNSSQELTLNIYSTLSEEQRNILFYNTYINMKQEIDNLKLLNYKESVNNQNFINSLQKSLTLTIQQEISNQISKISKVSSNQNISKDLEKMIISTVQETVSKCIESKTPSVSSLNEVVVTEMTTQIANYLNQCIALINQQVSTYMDNLKSNKEENTDIRNEIHSLKDSVNTCINLVQQLQSTIINMPVNTVSTQPCDTVYDDLNTYISTQCYQDALNYALNQDNPSYVLYVYKNADRELLDQQCDSFSEITKLACIQQLCYILNEDPHLCCSFIHTLISYLDYTDDTIPLATVQKAIEMSYTSINTFIDTYKNNQEENPSLVSDIYLLQSFVKTLNLYMKRVSNRRNE